MAKLAGVARFKEATFRGAYPFARVDFEFSTPTLPWDDAHHGTAALTTDWEATDVQARPHRGGWWDAAHLLCDEFEQMGRLTPRIEHRHGEVLPENREKKKHEPAALCLFAKLAPGEEHTFTVFIHWRTWATRKRSSIPAGSFPCNTCPSPSAATRWFTSPGSIAPARAPT